MTDSCYNSSIFKVTIDKKFIAIKHYANTRTKYTEITHNQFYSKRFYYDFSSSFTGTIIIQKRKRTF